MIKRILCFNIEHENSQAFITRMHFVSGYMRFLPSNYYLQKLKQNLDYTMMQGSIQNHISFFLLRIKGVIKDHPRISTSLF